MSSAGTGFVISYAAITGIKLSMIIITIPRLQFCEMIDAPIKVPKAAKSCCSVIIIPLETSDGIGWLTIIVMGRQIATTGIINAPITAINVQVSTRLPAGMTQTAEIEHRNNIEVTNRAANRYSFVLSSMIPAKIRTPNPPVIVQTPTSAISLVEYPPTERSGVTQAASKHARPEMIIYIVALQM